MGNTETLLPSRGGDPCCYTGLATAKWSYWVGLGRPLAWHGAPPALCSVLLLPYFLLFY